MKIVPESTSLRKLGAAIMASLLALFGVITWLHVVWYHLFDSRRLEYHPSLSEYLLGLTGIIIVTIMVRLMWIHGWFSNPWKRKMP